MSECPHGHLEGGCIYCGIGSKSLDDIPGTLSMQAVAGNVRRHQVENAEKKAIIEGLQQREILLEALSEVASYMSFHGIEPGLARCNDCNEILRMITEAIRKCMYIEAGKKI